MRLITKTKLAQMGKCSNSQITKLTVKGAKLADAVGGSGKIDLDHPKVIKWLELRDCVISPTGLTSEEFRKMTVGQIIDHYGNIDNLESYIKTHKLIVETEHKRIQMEASRDELVSRETIGNSCFSYLEAANKKLLDMPRGMVERIGAIIETNEIGCKEVAEQTLTEEISKILTNAIEEVSQELGNEKPA